jgi:hypothetical protein
MEIQAREIGLRLLFFPSGSPPRYRSYDFARQSTIFSDSLR